ncbi:hypothetical protein GCM10010172_07020 [Paractinoplanes ferrugineus]|uniref:DUF2637 domain-containing protein n=1 Tax=Paractinoplanes ferrugineus TaxID=113564 RepID=A0A919J825_9ACTN|nr:hypothetical protein [Actinoplanes ferrugineus]GIE16270.1 hypothetical protein Afe05nite_81100 [Actinoplanes ferrugineus]
MNSRQYLETEIARGTTSLKRVTWFVWSAAVLVMIYGIFVSFGPLKNHGVPEGVAWMPSLAADAAMCVAIIAGPVLAAFDLTAGWISALRVGAAFTTWALQTAGPWLADGGVDWAGVGLHSLPPLLLFLTAEGASSYMRKLGGALTKKRLELAGAEQDDADARAHRAEADAKLRSTAAELTAARAEVESLVGRLAAVTEKADADKAEATRTAEHREAEIGELRIALTAEREGRTADAREAENRRTGDLAELEQRLTADHENAVRAIKDKHREALTAARAEKGAVSLTAYRNRATGNPRPATSGKAELTDEDAVQMMLTAHDDPAHPWSKNGVRTLTGVGLGRAEKLIGLWHTAATEKANRKAVGE